MLRDEGLGLIVGPRNRGKLHPTDPECDVDHHTLFTTSLFLLLIYTLNLNLLPAMSVQHCTTSWTLVLLGASLVEGYLLQHSLLPDWAFRSVTLLALAGNLILRLVWGVVIYPYWVTPLRHLPTLPVYFISCFLITI